MATNKETINIDIKTTADTGGAEKAGASLEELTQDANQAAKSLFAIEDAAKAAQRELDVMEAKKRLAAREAGESGGLFGVDLSEKAADALEGAAAERGFGKQAALLRQAIGADAAAIGGSFAAIGAAAVASYKLLTGTVEGYQKLMRDAAAEGVSLGTEIEDQVKAIEATLSPLVAVTDFISEKWAAMVEVVTNPIDTISGLGDLRKSIEGAAEQMRKLDELRLKIANESQSGLSAVYDRELAALKEQEATIQRITALRNELSSLEVQGARQEVDAAKLRGGDVDLAQANLLAAQLKSGLAQLSDDLGESQRAAVTAKEQAAAAMVKYQEAIKGNLDKLDPAQFEQLSIAVDQTQTAVANADQAVTDQGQIFERTKANLLRGAENELARLDSETKGTISEAAEQARTGIYNTIKESFSSVISGAVELVQASNSEQSPARDALNQAASEGKATAAEMVKTASNLQTLGGLIQTTQSSFDGNVRELIALMRTFINSQTSVQAEIDSLKNQVGGIQARAASNNF